MCWRNVGVRDRQKKWIAKANKLKNQNKILGKKAIKCIIKKVLVACELNTSLLLHATSARYCEYCNEPGVLQKMVIFKKLAII